MVRINGIFKLQLISLDLKFQFGISHIQQSMLGSFIYIIKEFILPHDPQFILIKCKIISCSNLHKSTVWKFTIKSYTELQFYYFIYTYF